MLPRLAAGAAVGLYIGLTGARLKAADCLWSGIATHFIPMEKLDALESALLGSGLDEDGIDQALKELGGGASPDEVRARNGTRSNTHG